MSRSRNDKYNLLSQVPLPNLREYLKSEIQDDQARKELDLLTKAQIIQKIRLKNLSESQIEEIYNNYKYGNRLTFYIYFIPQTLNQTDEELFNNLSNHEFPQVNEETLNYESLPNLKNISFLDFTMLSDNETTEINFKYHSIIKYIKADEAENPEYVYQSRYGFIWVNRNKSFVILITKDEKVNDYITKAFYKTTGIALKRPILPKDIVNKFFPTNTGKSFTFTNKDGKSVRHSYPESISKFPDELQKIQDYENQGFSRPSARYQEEIDFEDGEQVESVINVSAKKAKITLFKTLSADQLREWGLDRFTHLINEIKSIKSTNIDQFFDMFSQNYLKNYTVDEKKLIKLIAGGIYNLIKNQINEITIDDTELLDGKVNLKNLFNPIPYYYCDECEKEYILKCSNCQKDFVWNAKAHKLICSNCKSEQDNSILQVCESNHRNTLELKDCLTLIPTNNLLEEVSNFISTTGNKFDVGNDFFFIKNSTIHYQKLSQTVEFRINDIQQFQDAEMNIINNDKDKYEELKEEITNLKEKCKKHNKNNCQSCKMNDDRCCLMKLFAYIEPSYTLEPHKGTEYGDISFTTKINGNEIQIKGIMKKAQKNYININTGVGKEILAQFVTQYLRDGYKPILAIIAIPGLERCFKADLIQLMRYSNGKVLFLGEEEMISLLDLAKSKGFKVA